MTLADILAPYADRELDRLSSLAKAAAVGCGQQMVHPKELCFEDWSLLDDMACSIFDAPASDDLRVAVFFGYFERFPNYNALTTLFQWRSAHPSLDSNTRSEIWRRLGGLLGAPSELADPVAYLLWVDCFENRDSVVEAWEHMLQTCVSEEALRRLLEIAGPVPFELKHPLYLRLLPDRRYHSGILRSLYFSATDAYGSLDLAVARSIVQQLHVDPSAVEFVELERRIIAEPFAHANRPKHPARR